jgi:hypothetical protein
MSATIYKMSQDKLIPVKEVSIAREDRFLGW